MTARLAMNIVLDATGRIVPKRHRFYWRTAMAVIFPRMKRLSSGYCVCPYRSPLFLTAPPIQPCAESA
ncbi:hypothetical protein DF3PB_930015 [uncultured Defluviicoccus sp.]|uniref:Uncharacterized protein n=1 Tax=metagenome TaxID=256318 RepID=A0A380TLJ2_9ZZZZ|nr:hypothetical protein DF3PB_930015 [uncultured Defluviicoccus sp.]